MKTAYLDPNYSQITKIILPMAVNESIITRTPGSHGNHPAVEWPRSMSPSLDDAAPHEREAVQQLYRQALEDAERDTEEKIR